MATRWPSDGAAGVQRLLRVALLSTATSLLVKPAYAGDPPALPRNTFGAVGLIDMPSARMAADGELSIAADFFRNNQRYTLNFQALPWLETSFRYAGLSHFNPDFPVYYDRSFETKIRLWQEGDWMPAVAVGIDDLVGTGVYGGEYIVASKQFGDLDATIGMGWGRLGTANTIKNPLGALSSGFYNRGGTTGLGGSFNFHEYFFGPTAGFFGGLDWRTPLEGLTLVAEVSSDNYDQERVAGNFRARSQFNFGASYDLASGVTLGLDWLYGTTLSGSISFQVDPTTENSPQKLDAPELVTPIERTAEQRQHALAALLNGGKSQLAANRFADANEMVDRLWRQAGVQDVEVRGHTLLVSVLDNAPAMRCLDFAQLVQAYENGLHAIALKSDGRLTKCATPAASDGDFRNGVFVGADDATAAHSIPTALVIDASRTRYDKAATRLLTAELKKQLVQVLAIQLTQSDAIIYYQNHTFRTEREALHRMTRVLMKDAPPDIERFRFIAVQGGVPWREFDVLREPQERFYALQQSLNITSEQEGATIGPAPMSNPIYFDSQRGKYPAFSWSLYPQFRQQYFDPKNPIGVEFMAAARGVVTFAPGVSLVGSVETSVYDTFNTARRSDSVLPHVRTDQNLYFTDGKTGIGQLEGDYEFRIAPNVIAIARAGYLESMFAGGGGEVLWRPENQRWALGVDGFEVWQRNFDRFFGLQQYHAFTGHISLYYESPWYGLDFAVRAGQYLARDRGLTLEVTRRFSTGVEIGAFVTKTNVAAQDFGEGSFDKGIMIRIPLGWAMPVETDGSFGMDLRPVQRDGGQRLIGDTILYNVTRSTSRGEIYRTDGSDPVE